MEFIFGEHRLDVDRRELRRCGEPIALQPQVFDLLVFLLCNRERVVSKDDLLTAIWRGRMVSDSTLATRINAARKAIGDDGGAQVLIRTVPRKGIRFVGLVQEETNRPISEHTPPPVALAEKPAIAVLPFANLTGDPEQNYLADGMQEEIITAVSRVRWLLVISRNSSLAYRAMALDVRKIGRELGVRYLLEGSVRKSGSHVRITAQLIDAATGAHLWADRFDGSLAEVFEFQDRVAAGVAGAIEPTLQAAEIRRAATRTSTDLTTYDLYLRALSEFTSCDRERLCGGLALLDQALVRDPNYPPILALAAVYRVELENHGWTDDPQTNCAEAIELARRALRSGADDPSTLDRVAVTLGRFGEDLDAAIALADRALVLNPSSADGWYRSGWLRLFAGLPDLAMEHFAASLRLDPRSGRGFHLAGIGTAHFLKQEFEQAAAALRASLEELPSFTPSHRILASCYAHMGRLDDARAVVARLRALTARVLPDIQLFRDPWHRELFLSGLRLAAD